ncbi:MAG: C4-dicarboxylate TRAP transporter substrate-binding protein [Spirochaetes bacterium]|nr:C4-dicarboxylate TRAP transporter substrate-binding protein [Spirochaetota bacterium]
MKMKKALSILAILLLFCPTLVFSQTKAKVKYRLNVGMVATETDPLYKGAIEFKKNVEARTNGEIAIGVYPNSLLGDTKDMQEQVKAGANIAVITDAARLAESVPAIGILGAPYIVEGPEEAKKLTTSALFRGWTDELADKYDYRVLSFNWYQGARHFWTNKPITVPADLKGLRIRIPGATVWQATIKAMGAEPTALGWAEVYPGIQQKVIDGTEAQHPASSGIRMYEVCKYLTKTSHFQLVTPLVCSESWFNTLPVNYQAILLEEALKAGDFATRLTVDGLAANEAEFRSKGVIITEPDVAPFRKACEAVYDQIPGYRDLKNQVNKILGK